VFASNSLMHANIKSCW